MEEISSGEEDIQQIFTQSEDLKEKEMKHKSQRERERNRIRMEGQRNFNRKERKNAAQQTDKPQWDVDSTENEAI